MTHFSSANFELVIQDLTLIS